VAGLTTPPTELGWVLARLGWLPVMAVVLVGIVVATRRFEAPWKGMAPPARVVLPVLAVVFGVVTAVLY
jgi:hypothetical protein